MEFITYSTTENISGRKIWGLIILLRWLHAYDWKKAESILRALQHRKMPLYTLFGVNEHV